MPPAPVPNAFSRSRTFTLTITGVLNAYSARAVVRPEGDDEANGTDMVGRCRVNIVSAPAGFSLVCDQLKPGGAAETDGDWRGVVDTADETGMQPEQSFNFHPGIGFRGKSGGTGGDIVIDVTWEARA